MKYVFQGLLLSAVVTLSACGNEEVKKDEEVQEDVIPAFELSSIDSSYTPCDDFYHFAAGNWIKNNPVPSTESRWGSFNVLFEENNKKLKAILAEVEEQKGKKKGSVEQLVGDFYKAAMDSGLVEKLGAKPIQGDLERISSVKTKENLLDLLAENQVSNGQGVIGFYVGQDDKDSESYISHLVQSGLGMPDRDYYLSDDPKSTEIRRAYTDHLQKTFLLIGYDESEAVAAASTVMKIETELAKISMTRTERRDPEKTYNKMTVDELNSMSSNIDWTEFLNKMNVDIDEVVVGQPEFLKGFDRLISEVKIEDWKTYLKWHVVDQNANFLSSDFVNQNFDFFGKTLNGTKELKPRWKRSMSAVNGFLGEPLGKLFVARHFPESSKQKVGEMVENLRSAYRDRINNLSWMSPETKKKALEKLEAFNYKIGYPDKWEDYSKVDIQADQLVQNIKNLRKFSYEDMIDKLGKPVDKDEWFMTPQTVNAYYSSSKNEIVFPAGILQPPFYNKDADDAINYGGIGAVIGHEFTHGFDDQGSKYDATGNLNNWWSEEDRSKFDERAQVVVEQFNGYEPLDSLHINGQLTLGENLADLGGLTLAYYAFQKSLENSEAPAEIDGFNHNQRFFLGWVNVWKNSITEEALRNRIITDPHSPGEYRVLGPLSNMKEFGDAFGCKAGEGMMRAEEIRAVVW